MHNRNGVLITALVALATAASLWAADTGQADADLADARLEMAVRLREVVLGLQSDATPVALDPTLFVPRDKLAVRPATQRTPPDHVAPQRRWPADAELEDPDLLRQHWQRESSADELRLSVESALRAPSEGPLTAPADDDVVVRSLEKSERAVSPDAWSPMFYGLEQVSTGRYYSGRVTQLSRAYDPAQGITTLWAGTVGGGLYKIVVAGIFAFWVPVSATLPGSPSVGAFVVRPSNGAEMIIGTGDVGRWGGDGIYKSVDGGATWVRTPTDPPTWLVYRLQASTSNDSIVMAATNAGVFRSTDFGDSWTRVLTGSVTEVQQDPLFPSFWYAAVTGVGVMESSNHGASFHSFGASCSGIPGTIGRTELSVSTSAPNYVFAVVENGGGALNGIYRSNDYGCNWTSIDATDTNSWGQAFHAIAIEVDPANANRLFVGMGGGQWTSQATAATPCWYRNAGTTSDCGLPQSFDAGHADMTDFLFDGSKVLIANDGGAFSFDPATHSVNDLGNALGFNSFQTVSGLQSLTTAYQDPDLLLAGLQDNGVAKIVGAHATTVTGGDGGVVSISPDNVDHFYPSYGLGWRRAGSHNGGASLFALDCGLADRGFSGVYRDPTPGLSSTAAFIFTLAPDPGGSGGEFVWYKPPSPTCDWQKVHSTSLPFTPVGFDQSNDLLRWTLWTWSWSDRRVAVMDSGAPGGMSWTIRTPPGVSPPQSGPGADMRLFADRSASQPGTAYYTTATASPPQAFVTTNRGATWRDVTGNLPVVLGNRGVFEMAGDPHDGDTLFVGTDVGVFRTDTATSTYPIWYRYMEGMPTVVRVFNMEVSAEGPDPPLIRVGTYGHSMWERIIAPTPFVFADGFEAGSTIAWSAAAP